MGLQDSKRKGLDRLARLSEANEQVGREMASQRERFRSIKEGGPTRVVSSFNLFQTPEWLADRMVSLCPIGETSRVLEPSAGLGRLYRAVRYRHDCEVVLVENSAECCRELYSQTRGDGRTTLVQRDFLECDAETLGGLFDAIVMNPPFRLGRACPGKTRFIFGLCMKRLMRWKKCAKGRGYE